MCTLAGGRDSRARVSRRDVQSHLEWARNLGGVDRGLIMPALSIPQLSICLLLLTWYAKRHFLWARMTVPKWNIEVSGF